MADLRRRPTSPRAIRAIAASIPEHQVELTTLDRAIGDGDHGENLDRGFKAVIAKLDADEPDTPGGVLKLVATTLISTVGGARAAVRHRVPAGGDGGRRRHRTRRAPCRCPGGGRDGVVARGKADSRTRPWSTR